MVSPLVIVDVRAISIVSTAVSPADMRRVPVMRARSTVRSVSHVASFDHSVP
jgi:hypothetical protein